MRESTAVELAYIPTAADAVGAIRARARVTRLGRLTRRTYLACTLVMLPTLAVHLTVPDDPDPVLTALSLVLLLLCPTMHFLPPYLQGKQIYRMVAEQGEFRTVVDDTGMRMVSRDSETTYHWPMIGRYTETETLFVLLTPDKHGVGIVILPKRGATGPADLTRLRTTLDRNTARA
ncbi:YcxB family protein [Streptomyces polyrhachis]|uniref:YcxB family protein n=1 Tax=Streptomyces polyrhachis TaxID=1282885 RepID=A0ABW2GKJ6_9ACTN